MDLPKTLDALHHAYVVSAELGSLVDALEKRGVPRMGCPDVYIYECQEFRIDNARELRERAYMNPLVLSRRIFIVSCAGIAVEAQNALLKTLEEPRGNAVFFFLMPSPERLLPTFRSRTQTLNVGLTKSHIEGGIAIQDFLAATPAKRLTMLEVFTKKKDGEERNMQGIHAFLDALERGLSARHAGLPAVYRAKRYIADKGALVKPLLEQVALLV